MNHGRTWNARGFSNTRGGGGGRSSRPDSDFSHRHSHAGDNEACADNVSRISHGGRGYSDCKRVSGRSSSRRKESYSYVRKDQQGLNSSESVGSIIQSNCSVGSCSAPEKDLSSLSVLQNKSEDLHLGLGRIEIGKSPSENEGDTKLFFKSSAKEEASLVKNMKDKSETSHSEYSEPLAVHVPFDICPLKVGKTVMLKPSLLEKNREKRNETKRSIEDRNDIVLRPGMVLLKGFISLIDQVKVVKKCRDLGLGSGGFYQPGYRDGAKLHLKMMCLGRNWDPETSKYGEHRPFDGAKPPVIPVEFYELVEKSIIDSHALIRKGSKADSVEDILPWMAPNICLVNFYSDNGRLGLHQDRDESSESLKKGLPVVSFSIGDSADFLYGDQRDTDTAEKVILESGDVLIFGGKSRHIFHGVTKIHPNTTPKTLLEKTDLRPGRINLTFRQY